MAVPAAQRASTRAVSNVSVRRRTKGPEARHTSARNDAVGSAQPTPNFDLLADHGRGQRRGNCGQQGVRPDPTVELRKDVYQRPPGRRRAVRQQRATAATIAGSRLRQSTARMTASTRAAKVGGPDNTRARVSAMCSQVQASLSW